MNTNHTPGPWRVGFDAEGSFPAVWNKFDATLGSRNNFQICDGLQSIDDAHLIASAPEMLAALEEITPLVQVFFKTQLRTNYQAHIASQAIIKAHSAIAKAKGNP